MEPHLRALVEQSPVEQVASVERLFAGSSWEADDSPGVGTGVASDVGVVIGTSDPWPSSDTVATIPEPPPPSVLTPTAPVETIPEPPPPSVLTPTAPKSKGMMQDNAPGAGGASDLGGKIGNEFINEVGAFVGPLGPTVPPDSIYTIERTVRPSAKVARDARETEDRAAGFDVFDAIDDATGGVARDVDVFVNEELGGQPGQTISARSYGTAVGDVLDYVAPGHTGSALVSYQIQSNTLPCIPKSYEAELAKHYRKTKKCSW